MKDHATPITAFHMKLALFLTESAFFLGGFFQWANRVTSFEIDQDHLLIYASRPLAVFCDSSTIRGLHSICLPDSARSLGVRIVLLYSLIK